jgi:hypothetical protein
MNHAFLLKNFWLTWTYLKVKNRSLTEFWFFHNIRKNIEAMMLQNTMFVPYPKTDVNYL